VAVRRLGRMVEGLRELEAHASQLNRVLVALLLYMASLINSGYEYKS